MTPQYEVPDATYAETHLTSTPAKSGTYDLTCVTLSCHKETAKGSHPIPRDAEIPHINCRHMRKKRDPDICDHAPNRGPTNNDHDGSDGEQYEVPEDILHHLQPKWRPASKNRTGAFALNESANYHMHAQMHNPEHTQLLLGGQALGRYGCRPCYCFADAVVAAAVVVECYCFLIITIVVAPEFAPGRLASTVCLFL